MIAHVRHEGLEVVWQLETHAHADHLSAAPYLQAALGGQLAIGAKIVRVQQTFGTLFNVGSDFARDGGQFDHLFDDGEEFSIGSLKAVALQHTPQTKLRSTVHGSAASAWAETRSTAVSTQGSPGG